MIASSAIEWTDMTWNPVRGCDLVSAGCAHCYAKTFSERWRGVPGHPFEHGFDLRIVPHKLSEPAKMPKSRKIFVNSMSDLFHERIPERYVRQVLAVMTAADWHIYQVLTKRPEVMLKRITPSMESKALAGHIWWGVSVENRKQGVPRINILQDAPVANRFLSIEPLLEDLGEIDLGGIGWVIVGGESGAASTVRPMRPEWVRSIRDQCIAAGVPFFFKQWGAFGWFHQMWPDLPPSPAGFVQGVPRFKAGTTESRHYVKMAAEKSTPRKVGKKDSGRRLDGAFWGQEPDWKFALPAPSSCRKDLAERFEESAKRWEGVEVPQAHGKDGAREGRPPVRVTQLKGGRISMVEIPKETLRRWAEDAKRRRIKPKSAESPQRKGRTARDDG